MNIRWAPFTFLVQVLCKTLLTQILLAQNDFQKSFLNFDLSLILRNSSAEFRIHWISFFCLGPLPPIVGEVGNVSGQSHILYRFVLHVHSLTLYIVLRITATAPNHCTVPHCTYFWNTALWFLKIWTKIALWLQISRYVLFMSPPF